MVQKVLEKILETAENLIEQSLNLFDVGREFYTKKHPDKDQALNFIGVQIQSYLDISYLLIREYAYLNDLKKPDIEVFSRAANCVEYLEKLSKGIDCAYPMFEEIKKDFDRIYSILQEKDLSKFSMEIGKKYNSWSEVYDDITRLPETHIKVWAAGIIDFLKFSDYYVKCLKQISFTKDEEQESTTLFLHNSDILNIFRESNDLIYYRKFNWVPPYSPPIDLLYSILKGINVSGFKEKLAKNQKPKNAWELLNSIIKGPLSYSNEQIGKAQKNFLYLLLDDLGSLSDEQSVFHQVVVSLIKENNNKKLKDFLRRTKKLEPKKTFNFNYDFLGTYYHMFTSILDNVFDSLIRLYFSQDKVISGLPRSVISPFEKERLAKETILNLAQKSEKQKLECAKSIFEITETLLYKIKNNEIKTFVFNEEEINSFIEGNKVIKKSLYNLISGLEEEVKEPPLHLAEDILLLFNISYLFESLQERKISRWKEIEEFIKNSFKANKLTWGLIEGTLRGAQEKITKEFSLTKEEEAKKTWDIFILENFRKSIEGLEEITDSYKRQLIAYGELKGLQRTAENYIPNFSKTVKEKIKSLFKSKENEKFFDPYHLEATLVKKLLEKQNKIDEMVLEKEIQPFPIEERIEELSTNNGSLYHEINEIVDWIAALSAFVDPEEPLNYFDYKERLLEASLNIEGEEDLERDYSFRNK